MMSGSSMREKFEDESAEYPEKPVTMNFSRTFTQCEGFTLPHHFPDFRGRIQNMEIRSADIWLCGLPKSGTTWAQEAVWCIANDADLGTAKNRMLKERFPFLDEICVKGTQSHLEDTDPGSGVPEGFLDPITIVEKSLSPRFVKSHLPLVLLPQELLLKSGAKIVYVCRNPRDQCISYYHYIKHVYKYEVDFEAFVERFLTGRIAYLPYWEHVLQFWRRRNDLDLLFITYEEMKRDLKKGILKIAQFLGKTLNEDQILSLTKHLSFENMKHNRQVNREPELDEWLGHGSDQEFSFMRCGQSGQWKSVMTESMKERFQKWEDDNLEGTDYASTSDQ